MISRTTIGGAPGIHSTWDNLYGNLTVRLYCKDRAVNLDWALQVARGLIL